MKPVRTLALNSERLPDLTGDELAAVAGGIPTVQYHWCLSAQRCPATQNLKCLVNTDWE